MPLVKYWIYHTGHLLAYGKWLLAESNPRMPVMHTYIHWELRVFNDDKVGITITRGIPKYVRHVPFVKLNLSHLCSFILRLEIIPPLSRQQSSWCADDAGVRISPWHTIDQSPPRIFGPHTHLRVELYAWIQQESPINAVCRSKHMQSIIWHFLFWIYHRKDENIFVF